MSTNGAFPPPTPEHPATTRASSRRGLTIGLAAGLIGGTAAGLVFGVPGLSSAAGESATITAVAEQSTDPTVEPTDTTDTVEPAAEPTDTTEPAAEATETTEPTTGPTTGPAAPADDPHASPQHADHAANLRERLQPLVDDGTITAEQADAVAAQLIDSVPRIRDLGKWKELASEWRGSGRHGGGLFGRGAGAVSEAVTDMFGLEVDELMAQLREGSTLADIATAQGIDPQTVIDELVGEVEVRLDAAVEKGYLDQSTADEKLAGAETWITEMVNNGAMPRHQRPDAPATPDATESED
jgi:hypothetical protein